MLIPVLNLEESVQLNDLTRFDATKSIKAKGGDANPINAVKIKAGADGSFINVYSSESDTWFLEWVFTSQNFDISNYNNVVNFDVQGTEYRALVASGTYTLANLLLAVKTAIEAIASPLTVIFTVDNNNRITIAPSLPLKLLLNKEAACLMTHLNFYDDNILTSLPVEYSIKEVTLQLETITPETATLVRHIKVLTLDSDKLFASDADLVIRERDIMAWTADGRTSFLAEHRKTQAEIIEWLFKEGYYDVNGKPLTKWSIVHTKEVRMWAIYKTLSALMLSFSNAVDDVFMLKYEKYNKLEIDARKIYSITLDTDNDGAADSTQDVGTSEGTLVHR